MSTSRCYEPPPLARRPRPAAALGLAAAVLCLHGGLMVALAPALPPRWRVAAPGQTVATVLQVRTVADAAAQGPAPGFTSPPAEPPVPRPAGLPTARRTERPERPGIADRPLAGPPRTAAPAPVAEAVRAVRSAAVPAPTTTAAAAAAPAVAITAPAASRSAPSPADPLNSEAEGVAASADRSDADVAAAAPPVYATRIPPPVRLRYSLRYNGQSGEATLDWRHDGARYQLALEGLGASQALVQQTSQGGFDRAGLAPERFTDRRRGGRLQAANFRRDIGRIGFSGPAVDYPAWPGAQDRLSWLPQLVAIRAAAAQAGEAGRSTTSLFVVDARGAAALWQFQPEGEAGLVTPLGPLATERWRREPPRPEGLRVEVWLDTARGHWPVQLRFTALRSGDVFELLLQGEPTWLP